jgi:DNA polymerase-3 subunit delta
MTFDALLRDLKNKIYHPVYFLFGDESFYLDEVSNYIEHKILQPHERDFNLSILYGKDSSAMQVIEASRRTPMMADYQVVILKEAQALDKMEELESYIKNPSKATILCMVYRKAKVDKRKTFFKQLLKSAVVLESQPIKDQQVSSWVKSYVESKGFGISDEASVLVAEYIGNNLTRVANEMNKVILQVGEAKQLEAEDITENIGISKDYNIFELGKAFGDKDVAKVFKIVKHFGLNSKNHPFIPTIGYLNTYFTKVYQANFIGQISDRDAAAFLGIPPFLVREYKQAARNYPLEKIRKVFSILSEYDLKSKGVENNSIEDEALYTELAYKILN